MASSVHPDQTPRSGVYTVSIDTSTQTGSTLFAKTRLSQYLGLLWHLLKLSNEDDSVEYPQDMFQCKIKIKSESIQELCILQFYQDMFVCVEVLRPSQPNGVMSSAVSLPNHTFTGQV